MFIELLTNTDEDIWVNPDHIVFVGGNGTGDTVMTLVTGERVYLAGKPSLIIEIIEAGDQVPF